MSMFIGESLAGDGNEVAHIDLLIGTKDGPVGTAFANALSRQSEGHSKAFNVKRISCRPTSSACRPRSS